MNISRITWRLAALGLYALLAGCASQPPAPEYKFYRLLGGADSPASIALRLPGDIGVRPLRTDALYSERAMVFTDEQQRQLQQYHYHHWLYPPGQLVQEHLAAYLRRTAIAPAVRLQDQAGDAPFTVSGRVARFERTAPNGKSQALVALDLRFERKGKLLWQQTYTAAENLADSSVNAYAGATEASLNRIYGEFLRDVARLKLD